MGRLLQFKRDISIVLSLWAILYCFLSSATEIKLRCSDGGSLVKAIQNAAPEDTIFLDAGVYYVTEPLAPRSYTHIIGAGQKKTILHFASDQPGEFFVLNGVEKVEIAHLTMDGANHPDVHQGIAGHNSRNISIHHVTVQNLGKHAGFGPHGIYFTGTSPTAEQGVTDSIISDCRFENIGVDAEFGGAIRLSFGSSRNQLYRNTIQNTGRGGIFCDNRSTDNVIRYNQINGSGGTGLGIEVWGGCDRSVIEHNVLDHWLSIGGSDFCSVRNNTIEDHSGTYKFAGIEAIGSFLIITDNRVDGGANIGLSVSGPQVKNYCLWARNTVRACNQWGAQLQGEEGGIAFHYFYKCKFEKIPVGVGQILYPNDEGNGFRILNSTRCITFEDCVFRKNGRFGLQIFAQEVEKLHFIRCTISGNKEKAVSCPPDFTELRWTDCRISGNDANAVPIVEQDKHSFPGASFRLSGRTRAGKGITFSNTSIPGSAPIVAALWDFGTGVPTVQTADMQIAVDSPYHISLTETVTMTYDVPGVYRVTLIVWDSEGRAGRAERFVSITR